MKAKLTVFKTRWIVLFIALSSFFHASAQHASGSSVENRIKNKNFVFVAQSVLPQRGVMRQLTTYYDLRVSGDTLTGNLPYFGRAYTAPVDPSAGGLTFTSTSFDYLVNEGKKSRWEVQIKPDRSGNVQQLILNVFDNNTASLRVVSANREPISFNGYIK
ncbi:MAG TPA: DUF4251 domain-containing protein [Chitinophagaceae bacterium]|nr:DUF4251 domain-containing protein [Chitinophagaceae bacterium]